MTTANLATASYAEMYRDFETIADEARAAASSARSNPFLTVDGQTDALHAADKAQGWTTRVDAIDAELAARTTRPQKTAEDALHTATDRPTGTDALAAQIRAQRFWARTKPVLDSKPAAGVLAAAMSLVETADPADLATTLEELPSYLQARGLDGGDVLDAALYRRLPAMARGRQDAERAATMHRSMFGPLIGFARELLSSVEAPTVPTRSVSKLAQVAEVEARWQTTGAAATAL